MAAKVKILEALADASAEDLAEIEAEIVKLERKLAGLRAAKSLVGLAVNGPPPKVVRGTNAAPRDEAKADTLASQVYDLIAKEGPLPIGTIASRLGKTPQGVALAASKSGWFARTAENDLAIARKA